MPELKKSEKRLMAITGVCLAAFLVSQFVCGKGETPAPAAPKTAKSKSIENRNVQNKSTQKASLFKADLPEMQIETRDRSTVKFASWGRNPFAEAYRLAKFDSSAMDSNSFVLRGIIWKGNQAHALIGDEILREGQSTSTFKVIDIQRDRVVCKKGSKVVTLVMNND